MLRYAITNGRAGLSSPESANRALPSHCGALARSGVDFILIREKALGAATLAGLSREVVAAVRAAGPHTRILIAGRADVALAAGAHGVHLASGTGQLRVREVRTVFPVAVVSVSCHSPQEAQQARDDGASAVLFAPVFGKWVDGVKVLPGVGLNALGEACAAAGSIPVFALGGVTEANAQGCLNAGAAGIAGIRMFFGE